MTRVSPVSRATSALLCAPAVYSVCSTSARLWLRACSGSTLFVGRRARERVKIGAPANGTVSRSEAPI